MHTAKKISCCAIAAAVLACFSTACSTVEKVQSGPIPTANHMADKERYDSDNVESCDAYISIVKAFADYANVREDDVSFFMYTAPVVYFLNNDRVYCNGRTKVYSFQAGDEEGTFYCDSYFVRDSIDTSPPHVVDGYYPYDSEENRMIFDDGYHVAVARLTVFSPISFDEETENRLGYSSQEIAEIVDQHLSSEPEMSDIDVNSRPSLFRYTTI